MQILLGVEMSTAFIRIKSHDYESILYIESNLLEILTILIIRGVHSVQLTNYILLKRMSQKINTVLHYKTLTQC